LILFRKFAFVKISIQHVCITGVKVSKNLENLGFWDEKNTLVWIKFDPNEANMYVPVLLPSADLGQRFSNEAFVAKINVDNGENGTPRSLKSGALQTAPPMVIWAEPAGIMHHDSRSPRALHL